jgi:hypothetical protein
MWRGPPLRLSAKARLIAHFGSALALLLALSCPAAADPLAWLASSRLVAEPMVVPMPADRRVLGDGLLFRRPLRGLRVSVVRDGLEVPLEEALAGTFMGRWAFQFVPNQFRTPIDAAMAGPNCMNAVTCALGLESEQRQTTSREFLRLLARDHVAAEDVAAPGDVLAFERWGEVSHAGVFLGRAAVRATPGASIEVFFHKLGANVRAPYLFTDGATLRLSGRFGAKPRAFRVPTPRPPR